MYIDVEETMRKMFHEVHGELTNCHLVIEEDEDTYSESDMNLIAKVMKGENLCWQRTRDELLYEYIAMKMN